jgi:hypothetical protein
VAQLAEIIKLNNYPPKYSSAVAIVATLFLKQSGHI